jgi:hypothetical protein
MVVTVLIENTESKDLGQRITDVARNEKNGLLIILMGAFLVSAGLIISVIGNSSITYIGGLFCAVLGVFSTIFGFYVSVRYARQYNRLLKELETA